MPGIYFDSKKQSYCVVYKDKQLNLSMKFFSMAMHGEKAEKRANKFLEKRNKIKNKRESTYAFIEEP